MDIVSRIKFFLDVHNIANSQFADKCDIPRPTVSQLLNGKNKKISNINKNKIWNKLTKMLYYILMVHYSSHTLFYEGGAKNPLKGTSVKFLVFARNASFV